MSLLEHPSRWPGARADARLRRAAPALGAAGLGVLAGAAAAAQPLVMIAGIGAVAGAIAFAARPYALLLLLVALRPSLDASGAFVEIGGANLAGLMNAATFAGGGPALLFAARDLPGRRAALCLLGFLVVAAASIPASPQPSEAVRAWIGLGALLVVFGLARWTITSAERLQRLAVVVMASAAVPVTIALGQFATGRTVTKQGFDAVAGTFVHPNGLGFFLVLTIAVTTGLFIAARSSARRVLLTAIAGLLLACLALTFARSAWIALVVVLALLALFEYRRLLWVTALVAVLVAVAVPSSVGVVESRFSDLSTASTRYGDNSISWREENWRRMWPYALERPLRGQGLASYLPLSRQEFGPFDYNFRLEPGEEGVPAHNDYLYLSVELGFPGVLLWIAFLTTLAVGTWRARRVAAVRPLATAVTGVLAAVVLISAVDNVIGYSAVLYGVLALAGGLIAVARER